MKRSDSRPLSPRTPRVANSALIAIFLPLAAVFSGCTATTPRCGVLVSNVSPAPVHSVIVELPDDETLQFGRIEKDSSAVEQIAPYGMERITKLRVKAGNSPEELYEIDLRAPVPPDFRGQVTFQVEEYNRIRVFVEQEERDDDQGVLPWDTQPSWVASPTIPGMSGE